MLWNTLIKFLSFGILLMMARCGTSQMKSLEQTNGQKISERLELIKLSDLSGKSIHLHEYAGKPIFLNFWATWCMPCKAELITIQEVAKRFDPEIIFLIASIEEPAKIIKYKEDHGLDLNFVRLEMPYIDAYIIKLPTTLLFDGNGQLILEEEGYRNWTQGQYIRALKNLSKRTD